MALLTTVEVAQSLAAIEALQRDWIELERRTPEATGFQSYAWCHAWVKALHGEKSKRVLPHVIIVRVDRRVVWLLPLQVERIGLLRYARALGQPATQYADALAEPSESRSMWWSAVERKIKGHVDLVAMIQIRVDSVLATTPGVRGIKDRGQGAPHLKLSNGSEPHGGLTYSRSLRRRHRRLAERGSIEYCRPTDPDQVRWIVVHTIKSKEIWLSNRGLDTTRLKAHLIASFYQILASNNALEAHLLRLGTEVAATDFGFYVNKSYRSLMSSYNLQLANCAPGHFLTRRLIDHYVWRGSTTVDLLPPSEPYKNYFCNKNVAIFSLHIHFTLAGLVGAFASLHLREMAFFVDQKRFKLVKTIRRIREICHFSY